MHDVGTLAIAAGEVGADDGVRALDLVVDGLAEVVKEAGPLGCDLVDAELGGHDAAERGDLRGVGQDVLSERGAIAQRAEGLDELGVQVVDAGVEGGLLPGLADALGDEGLGLLVELLDAGGVDAAVGDQVLERNAGGLATHRVEAREHDGLGRVVDDEGHAGDLLEGADVAALAADDAALEVVRGDVDRRDRDLAGLVGGAALDGGRDDLAGGLVGLGADALLGLAQDLRLVADGLGADAGKQLVVGLVGGEAGDALELGGLAHLHLVEVVLAAVELTLEARELVASFRWSSDSSRCMMRFSRDWSSPLRFFSSCSEACLRARICSLASRTASFLAFSAWRAASSRTRSASTRALSSWASAALTLELLCPDRMK